MVAEGMTQRIGVSGRQTVLAVFVGSGVAFGIGMGGQTTCTIVAEGLFAAVGIEGEGKVLIGVVVVFGVLSQRIGNARQLSFGGVDGELMVETAFGNQTVEDVVGKAVACTVFIGQADQAAGFVVMVTEGMA